MWEVNGSRERVWREGGIKGGSQVSGLDSWVLISLSGRGSRVEGVV